MGSTKVVNAIEELGYLADALYPLFYYEKQLSPYHRSRKNWLERGDLRIVEISNFTDMSIDSQDPYGRDHDQWLLYRSERGAVPLEHLDGFVVRSRVIPLVVDNYICQAPFQKRIKNLPTTLPIAPCYAATATLYLVD